VSASGTRRRARTGLGLKDAKNRTSFEAVPADQLRRGDVALVTPGELIPGDGEVIEGAAGDVNTLLLDKTGTITLGNRQAVEFVPAPGVTTEYLADRAQLASLPDECGARTGSSTRIISGCI